jgi:hypothetical protein
MIWYRPATIVAAAKLPSLDETRAGTAAALDFPIPDTGVELIGITAVSELSTTGLPQAKQKRLVSGICDSQDKQRVILGLFVTVTEQPRPQPPPFRRII